MDKEAPNKLRDSVQDVVDSLNRLSNMAVEYRKEEWGTEDVKATNTLSEAELVHRDNYITALSDIVNLTRYYRNSLLKYSRNILDSLEGALSVTANRPRD